MDCGSKFLRMLVIGCAVVVCGGLTGPVWAEEAEGEVLPAWKPSLTGGASFAQSSFSNWAQGGEDFIAWTFAAQGGVERVTEKWNWKTILELEYGFVTQGDEDARKSADRIRLESIWTRELMGHWGVFVAGSARTQFAEGKDYKQDPAIVTSAFADPIYLTQSAGVNRELAPGLNSRAGFQLQEVRTDKYRQYSDDEETTEIEDLKVEAGLTSVTGYEGNIREGLRARSKLSLFYSFKQTDELDVDWDSSLILEVTRFITVNYSMQILYDEDVDSRRQIKQFLGIGVLLTIF